MLTAVYHGQNRHHEERIGEFYSSTGNKNSRKRKLENFWIFILVWIKYCILVAILWSDIFIHDLISQIEHFCYWNFSANFVRQYYKIIWANFCWQLYIMGKIDIMKSVSESFTVLQGTKIHEKGNWKISEFLFLCEVRLREHPLLEHWNCHKKNWSLPLKPYFWWFSHL